MTTTPATDALRTDHREIEVHLDRLLAAAKHLTPELTARVREEFLEIRRHIQPHFEQEENVFYPHLREAAGRVLAQMDDQHEYVREVEQCLEELLQAIGTVPTDRQLAELVRFCSELFDTIQHHIVDEEDLLLRLADATLSPDEQADLFARMQDVVKR